jgi:pyrroloquinoline quinone (PQQ) biosynthesis protein C
MDATAAANRSRFRTQAELVVSRHPIVLHNAYSEWFASGQANREEVRHLTVQFSVFSHLFLEAQLMKVINAASLDAYRAGKEILMNELGVIFVAPEDRATSGDAESELLATEGSVDGGRFKFGAAHFEWLLRFASPLGLGFNDLGKRRHGTPSTLRFCDDLLAIYGSEDASVAAGASYAVEHWAAAGFWKQLIAGFEAFNAKSGTSLPLAFWKWHDRADDQHTAHTDDELDTVFLEPWFNQKSFLDGAGRMLDSVDVFWTGLWSDQQARRKG